MGRDRELHARTCKERYEWYNARGICTSCGRTYSEPGHILCKACKAKIKVYDDRDREKRIERKRKQRQERIAAGLCTECGKPATPGMRMCPRCRAMRNDSTRKYKIHQRTLKAQQSGIPPTEKERYSKWR